MCVRCWIRHLGICFSSPISFCREDWEMIIFNSAILRIFVTGCSRASAILSSESIELNKPSHPNFHQATPMYARTQLPPFWERYVIADLIIAPNESNNTSNCTLVIEMASKFAPEELSCASSHDDRSEEAIESY